MSKWDRAIYCFHMPTVDVNILSDSAACCCQIALILRYTAFYLNNQLRLPSLYAMIIPLLFHI